MVEGSLWVFGRTDLTDYYRGDLTLRQIYVRLVSLPDDAPARALLHEEQERADAERRVTELERQRSDFLRRWGNG